MAVCFKGSTICIDPTSSQTGSQQGIHPNAMSMYPILSPPKNLFPLISSSNLSITSLASFTVFSCSSPLPHIASHDVFASCYITFSFKNYLFNSCRKLLKALLNSGLIVHGPIAMCPSKEFI
uniref:Uncharacterized protein n=1 Tax=Cajanus cajan TaxID=3821 RepID=A0A151R185_CAJCA|nr:hypothetical protein KK1_042556 [Cajanus cajan]